MEFQLWFKQYIENIEAMTGATLNQAAYWERGRKAFDAGQSPSDAAHHEMMNICGGE